MYIWGMMNMRSQSMLQRERFVSYALFLQYLPQYGCSYNIFVIIIIIIILDLTWSNGPGKRSSTLLQSGARIFSQHQSISSSVLASVFAPFITANAVAVTRVICHSPAINRSLPLRDPAFICCTT